MKWYGGTVGDWYSGKVVHLRVGHSGRMIQLWSGTVVEWYSGRVVQRQGGTIVQ